MKRVALLVALIVLLNPLFALEEPTWHIQKEATPVANYLQKIEIKEKQSGIVGIDCIYVINLDSRPDRLQRIQPLLQTWGLKFNRVSAVNGWSLSAEDLQKLSGPYPVRLKGGEYGCLLSHISILMDAHKRGFNCIWVLEDDLDFVQDPHCIPPLLKQLSALDPKWDLFYTDPDFRNYDGTPLTSYSYSQRPDQLLFPYAYYQQRPQLTEQIVKIGSRWGTTSMIYSKRGIKKALDYFTHVYLFSPIDHDIHTIYGIKEYAPIKPIVSNWPRSTDSNTRAPPNGTAQQAIGQPPSSPFWGQYQKALALQHCDGEQKGFLSALFEAHTIDPRRAEPLYRIAEHYRKRGDLIAAYLIAKQALALSRPEMTEEIEHWIYDYGLLMELSLSSYYLNRFDETKRCSEHMLLNPSLPEEYRKAALENLTWVKKQKTSLE